MARRQRFAVLTCLVGFSLWLSAGANAPAAQAEPPGPGGSPTAGNLARILGLAPGGVGDLLSAWARSQFAAGAPDGVDAGARAGSTTGAPGEPTIDAAGEVNATSPDDLTLDAPRLYLPLALQASRPTPPPAPIPTPTPPIDPTAALFDPNRLLEIQIELDSADWDELRWQARTMAGIFGEEECMTEPLVSPFTYFPANVRVDGELVEHVGVRKKGLLGSISSTKPSLKIKFDEYVADQRLSGIALMTLNNDQQDPSHLRQCLTYGLFAKAGLPAPRCNFAHVTVNGRDLGVYAHIESITKPLLARQFGDDGGNLYEGTLSDFRPEWVGTFQRKTHKSDADRSDLDALVAALEVGDDDLLPALATVLDVDEYLDFWGMEVLTGHWDGYASNRNNFYLYGDPADGRFHFIPWGTDGTMQSNFRPPPDGGPPLASVVATARLPRRLYQHPLGRYRYLGRLTTLLDQVWDEPAILAEIDRMAALIRPALAPDLIEGFQRDVEATRAFVRSRRPAIATELAGGPPAWDNPESGPPCRQTVGRFRATFAVPWAQPGVLTATAQVQLFGAELELAEVGAAAGTSGSDPWPAHAAIHVVGITQEEVPPIWHPGDALLVIVYVDPALFGSQRTIAIDGQHAFAWVILAPLNEDGTRRMVLLGMLWDGELTLQAAGTKPGEIVSGTIDANIVVFGGL